MAKTSVEAVVVLATLQSVAVREFLDVVDDSIDSASSTTVVAYDIAVAAVDDTAVVARGTSDLGSSQRSSATPRQERLLQDGSHCRCLHKVVDHLEDMARSRHPRRCRESNPRQCWNPRHRDEPPSEILHRSFSQLHEDYEFFAAWRVEGLKMMEALEPDVQTRHRHPEEVKPPDP